MEKSKQRTPKKGITVFLIFTTLLLTFALFGCGVYSLYISIGFRFLQRSTVAGINTNALYAYPSSVYGTGGGTMVGLILISVVMLALGVGMGIIFFKQLPLYKQIKLISKMPSIKYKDYSKQAKKRVIVYSIIAYVVCIAFSIFAIITAANSGIAANYLWIVLSAYIVVLGLSISSMILMIVKIVQLSKIKNILVTRDLKDIEKCKKSQEESGAKNEIEITEIQESEPQIAPQIEELTQRKNLQDDVRIVSMMEQNQEKQETQNEQQENPLDQDKFFTNGIFELSSQLQKLREMLVVGLINTAEYEAIRSKWIDALLGTTILGKKQTRKTYRFRQTP